ncbi:hypothetical protein [Henriciella sp.]|uniref:hypothetical protein n=1 Tax=Henriciella sp. TaxID=1968823 RepID=UPI0017A41CCB|nr:hypothetical protein [Henriciella sp.]HIG22218.1 hypothetical protein [Henriciella sp.]
MLEFIEEHFQIIILFLIALVAIYVAYQQHLTRKKSFKLALFDRRVVIYDALKDFLVSFQRDLTIDFEQFREMRRQLAGAEFLYGPKVIALNQEIIDFAVEYLTVQDTLKEVEHLSEDERRPALQREKALTLRLVAALDRVNEAYKPYLHFSRVK